MTDQPTAITAHTYTPHDNIDVERRSCVLAAQATGNPQGLHRHRHGEACHDGCLVVEADGTERPLLRQPDQTVRPTAAAPIAADGTVGAPVPLHAPILEPDPTGWPAIGEPTGSGGAVTDQLDLGGYSADPKSRNGHQHDGGAAMVHGRDAGL